MTLILKFDLDIIKMYLYTKSESPSYSISKVIAQTAIAITAGARWRFLFCPDDRKFTLSVVVCEDKCHPVSPVVGKQMTNRDLFFL